MYRFGLQTWHSEENLVSLPSSPLAMVPQLKSTDTKKTKTKPHMYDIYAYILTYINRYIYLSATFIYIECNKPFLLDEYLLES